LDADRRGMAYCIKKRKNGLTLIWAGGLTGILFVTIPLSDLMVQLTGKKTEQETVEFQMYQLPRKKVVKKTDEPKKREQSTPKFADVKQKLTPLQAKVELPVGASVNKKNDFDFEFKFTQTLDVSDLIFDLDQVDAPPEIVVKIPPVYPLSARRLNKQGSVSLLFVVTDEGNVEEITVVDSQPDDLFVDAAVHAVKKWKFKPARRENTPVAVRIEITLAFSLQE
jgi:periplasmic protein TonB